MVTKVKRLPDHLPGIDLQQALRRLGNAPLLRSLLISFMEENAETMQTLRDALVIGDNQRARRIVHTAKGVGGNLGTTGLCEAALSLEEAIIRGWGAGFEEQAALDAFGKELQQVLASIRSFVKAEVDYADAQGKPALDVLPVDNERVASLAGELADLLEVGNMKALGVWGQLKPLLPGANLEKLEKAISSLNFSHARGILAAIVASTGVNL